jgi:TrmH family RNA methyltransferase
MTKPGQIVSIKDKRIVQARTLSSASGRRRAHKCLLQGAQIIQWALAAHVPIEHVLFHDKIKDHPLFGALSAQRIDCLAVSEGILKKVTGTRYLIPFVGVARLKSDPAARLGDFVIVLDGVQDHGNVGTIVRTARGFGVRDVLATRQDFDLFYKKTIEASRGKVFDVRLRRFDSGLQAVQNLKEQGFQIVATSPHAATLQAAARLQEKPLALVVGNETTGVSHQVLQNADLVVQIPMSSQVESLNVGVATGISVYEFKLKLVLTMLTKYIRTTLGRKVNVAGKLIQAALDTELKKVSDFDGDQIILLMILKCDQVMSLEQARKDTATSEDELQELLGPLLDGGHVQYYENDPATIQLTDRGEHLIAQLWGIIESSEDEILQGFSNQEKKQLVDYLQRIQANCEKIIRRASS